MLTRHLGTRWRGRRRMCCCRSIRFASWTRTTTSLIRSCMPRSRARLTGREPNCMRRDWLGLCKGLATVHGMIARRRGWIPFWRLFIWLRRVGLLQAMALLGTRGDKTGLYTIWGTELRKKSCKHVLSCSCASQPYNGKHSVIEQCSRRVGEALRPTSPQKAEADPSSRHG